MTDYRQTEAERRGANALMFATIAAVDLAAGRVVVELDEDGWQSAPLPWIEAGAGRLRSWSPPVQGEQVILLSPSGEPSAGVVLRGLSTAAFPLPSADPDTTLLLWDDGALDRYNAADRTRTLEIPNGGKIVLQVGDARVVVEDATATIDAANVLLGPEGSRQAVARVGDKVRITAGSSAGEWPIISGSSAVKAS